MDFYGSVSDLFIFSFGRVPRCARVGVLRATLTLRCYALLTHPPHASRTPLLDVLPCFLCISLLCHF
ncbi:MAG: hypothetical protein NZ455_03460 [Bacteroidia bacterium]|nr:hypothetical protein [Bacteroidia bacterium]